jgi:hypothetical protein
LSWWDTEHGTDSLCELGVGATTEDDDISDHLVCCGRIVWWRGKVGEERRFIERIEEWREIRLLRNRFVGSGSRDV